MKDLVNRQKRKLVARNPESIAAMELAEFQDMVIYDEVQDNGHRLIIWGSAPNLQRLAQCSIW